MSSNATSDGLNDAGPNGDGLNGDGLNGDRLSDAGPNNAGTSGAEERRDAHDSADDSAAIWGEPRAGNGIYRTSLQQRQACYEQAVRTAIANQFPLGPEDRQTLGRLQQALKLSDDVAQSINQRVSALAAEEEARYQAILQRYEEELRHVLEQGQALSTAERQRLTQKLSQWEISPKDADIIERQVRARYQIDEAAPSAPMAATQLESVASEPDPASQRVGAIQVWSSEVEVRASHPAPASQDLASQDLALTGDNATSLEAHYGRLDQLLQTAQWQAADQETFQCLLQACDRLEAGWLDRAAIEGIPQGALLTIDQLWHRHSEGQFSFKRQREIALAASRQSTDDPLWFGQQVGWLLWNSPMLGFKYYRQLTFDRTAPPGHLPAKWFWAIPLQQALRCGGLTPGRGGCAKDGGLLTALHQVLDQVYAAE